MRCRGKTCPFRMIRRQVTKGKVRFRAIERRFLRGGVRIEVFVRAPGFIGKYSSWLIRNGKAPRRTDRCLPPASSKPTRCPL